MSLDPPELKAKHTFDLKEGAFTFNRAAVLGDKGVAMLPPAPLEVVTFTRFEVLGAGGPAAAGLDLAPLKAGMG